MERLGQYHIVDRLGAGGMGEVYRARDTKLGRMVAIKVLPEALVDDPERRERLLREARASAALSHPNICALFEVGGDDTRQCIGAVLLLVARDKIWLERLGAFAWTGRMALTNYMIQVVMRRESDEAMATWPISPHVNDERR